MKNGPYELIVAPKNYPGMKYRGRYAYEHIVVWWEKHGKIPDSGFEIHHKNGNHRDNRIENLDILTSKQHRVAHGLIRTEKCLVDAICGLCGISFKRKGNQYRSSIKSSKTGKMYCSQECQYNSMRK